MSSSVAETGLSAVGPRHVIRISAAVRQAGIEFIQASAQEIVRQPKGLRIVAAQFEIDARTAVIAAGARSRRLAAQIGDPVPLDTERGYHVEFDMTKPPIERPVYPTAQGFYLCPMRGRLRVAGLVELGGLTAPVSPRLVENLAANARRIFLHLGEPSRTGSVSGLLCPIPFRSFARRGKDGMSFLPSATAT